jgi:hypothetical protein
MSTNVPDWVQQALVAAREQKIANGKLIPGRERFPLTLREQAFLGTLIQKEAAPATAETVIFDALGKLNNDVGRRY